MSKQTSLYNLIKKRKVFSFPIDQAIVNYETLCKKRIIIVYFRIKCCRFTNSIVDNQDKMKYIILSLFILSCGNTKETDPKMEINELLNKQVTIVASALN